MNYKKKLKAQGIHVTRKILELIKLEILETLVPEIWK